MSDQESPNSLENARERLYSPRAVEAQVRKAISASGVAAVPHAWGMRVAPKAHPHIRLALVFFLAAIAFFIVAGGIAALVLFSGSTSVSTDNISLQTQGPTTIAAGDTVPLSLAITNKNVVPLENATLEIDFPQGTRDAKDNTKDYPRYTEDLGTIAPGATILRSVKAVIFAQSGTSLTIPISLSYEASGSNATFVKKATYPISINSAPLSTSLDAPTEAVPGQPFTISATVRSNATTPLSNVILAAQLPYGFTLTSSSQPVGQGGAIALGTLAPGASTVVSFTGTLSGQAGDVRDFRFSIGTANTANASAPSVVYMTQDAEVAITAPFLATTLAINGDSSASPVLTADSNQNVTISWRNTLSVPLQNATISVALAGAVAPGSIQSSGGYFDSNSGTITFSQSSDPSLANLAPGAAGLGSFSFKTAAAGSKSKAVTFIISISGERVGESNVPGQVNSSAQVVANIASAVAFTAQTLHSSGPIANSGPIPPTAGSATTYTVLWKLSDPGNDVTNNVITTTLPQYVTFTKQISPSNANLTYDSGTRTVSWRPGDLATGQTTTASFQVSITPSTSQSGSSPTLTSAINYSGFDRYAQVPVSSSAQAVTTETTADPGYQSAYGSVQ